MTATRTANIYATIYDGKFDIGYDCVGPARCRFALCSLMPPDGSEQCWHCVYGACQCPSAKVSALEALKRRITKEIKRLNGECE